MIASRQKAFTLLEVIVVVVILTIVVAICLPLLSSAGESARRTACAHNMQSLGKVMILYADQGGSLGIFPTTTLLDFNVLECADDPKTDAQMSLNLLYKSFVNDLRVFSCPSKPMSAENIARVWPSTLPGWQEHSLKQEPPGNPVSWATSTSYGYSPGHRQEDGACIILADHQGNTGTGTKQNSDNHGRGAGQNCLAAGGNLEFRDNIVNRLYDDGKGREPVVDSDIYSIGGVTSPKDKGLDSWCR